MSDEPRRVSLEDYGNVADLAILRGETNGTPPVEPPPEPDPWTEVDEPESPLARPLHDFLALEIERPAPLVGTGEQQLLPAGGMVLIAGQAGRGKTTLIVDLLFHLASGVDWLSFPVERPLNCLIIENEGPMHNFQAKLERKASKWENEILGEIHVQTLRWGWFSFADPDLVNLTRRYLDENVIDLVVGDPIATLGLDGVGSPDQTRAFVNRLVPLGLTSTRTFIFPAHFRKEPSGEEIDQISGAWGGHLDSLMVLKAARRPNELRLSFPKLRWWEGETPAPHIIGKVLNTASFELLGLEGDHADLEREVIGLLEDGVWRTATEIAKKHELGGIGRRRKDVDALLQDRKDLFRWESGAEHGKSAKAIVWQLSTDSPSDLSHTRDTSGQVGQVGHTEADADLSHGVPPSVGGGTRDESHADALRDGSGLVPGTTCEAVGEHVFEAGSETCLCGAETSTVDDLPDW